MVLCLLTVFVFLKVQMMGGQDLVLLIIPIPSTCNGLWYVIKSHGRRSLVGCSPWGLEESDRTERLHFHFSVSCIGEGNGNPLQCSCLENPRDGGAWWAAVYRVAQSWTRLKQLSSSMSFFSKVLMTLQSAALLLSLNHNFQEDFITIIAYVHTWVNDKQTKIL